MATWSTCGFQRRSHGEFFLSVYSMGFEDHLLVSPGLFKNSNLNGPGSLGRGLEA